MTLERKVLTPEQLAALRELHSGHSHDFWPQRFAEKWGPPFGLDLVETVHANTGDPKGLHVGDGTKRTLVKGVSGFSAVQRICNALDVAYEYKLGRGFQFHECFRALAAQTTYTKE